MSDYKKLWTRLYNFMLDHAYARQPIPELDLSEEEKLKRNAEVKLLLGLTSKMERMVEAEVENER